MCVVSSIGDNFTKRLGDEYPWATSLWELHTNNDPTILIEVEKLKEEMKELRKLLEAAKDFDEKTGQKDCEMDEKVSIIKNLAKLLEVDMGNVFEKEEKL